MWMYCYVMYSVTPPFMNVLLCDVKSHTALHECIVMWCTASHRPSCECIVMWCTVSHRPSCECIVMWCTVPHRPSWMYCYVMYSVTPPFMNVLLCDVQCHTALHVNVLLCDVQCHTALHVNVSLCDVQFHTAVHECIVVWCKVSHGPSWMYCYVMYSVTPPFVNVLLCDVM